jgi:DNA-binding XRE family transcriptional regulator
MKTRRWRDVLAERRTPEEIAALDRRVSAAVAEMDLRELRIAAGMTQEQMAEALKSAQSEISRLEKRDDYRLSTLREYVHALGGHLEIVAKLGNRRVRLRAS